MIPDRLTALRWALEEAQPQDTVLIAGAAVGERLFAEQLLRYGANDEMNSLADSDSRRPSAPTIYRIDDYR